VTDDEAHHTRSGSILGGRDQRVGRSVLAAAQLHYIEVGCDSFRKEAGEFSAVVTQLGDTFKHRILMPATDFQGSHRADDIATSLLQESGGAHALAPVDRDDRASAHQPRGLASSRPSAGSGAKPS
jgi:hypothetical protein